MEYAAESNATTGIRFLPSDRIIAKALVELASVTTAFFTWDIGRRLLCEIDMPIVGQWRAKPSHLVTFERFLTQREWCFRFHNV